MKIYRKVIAKHSPKNGCYAADQEQLQIANVNSWPKESKAHYFVGIDSGKRSRFGWVNYDSKPDELLLSNFANNREGVVIIRQLECLKAGDAVSLDFVRRGMPPSVVLLLHKVLFYDTL